MLIVVVPEGDTGSTSGQVDVEHLLRKAPHSEIAKDMGISISYLVLSARKRQGLVYDPQPQQPLTVYN